MTWGYRNPIQDNVWTWDVVWPWSSTDNAVARFDGTWWKTIQNSWVIVDDSDNVYIPWTIDLWHASDTTLSRVSAWVVAIEWTNIVKAWAVTSNWITMSTARLLWRTTASTGAIEEITVWSGLTLSAWSLTATWAAVNTTIATIRSLI